MDGLGRVVLVQDSRTNAYVKSEYDVCSCSATGRAVKLSNPYLSGETPQFTVSEYDALGRNTPVTAPDGSAATSSFAGNTTTVTDPAGKRKKFTYDAFGKLTQVAEPDGSGNLTVLTNYTHDEAGHLTGVSMNNGAQTRGFAYNQYNQLISAANPENGTVSYTYDGHLLASKIDAKNQVTNYEYDTYKRLTRIAPPNCTNCDDEKRFYYDSYEADPGEHTYGRLAAIEWGPPPASRYVTWSYVHAFGYNSQGQLTRSKLTRNETYLLNPEITNSVTLQANFTWTMQGQPASITYPSGATWYYRFDSAGRPNGLGVPYGGLYVTNTAFNKAGQMTTLTDYAQTETRTYDPNTLQLTRIQVPGALDLSYVYPSAGANNGRITAEVNNLTNTTVSYTYDQLNRLATATSVTGSATNWGLRWDQDANGNPGYDPYGNRRTQTVTAGSAPAFSATFDNNNRMVGYSYDQNGNQLATPDGAVLEYNRDNRMTVWSHQGAWETYDYHPSGWRVSKVTATSDTLYLYGPGGQLLSACPVVNGVRGTCSEPVYFAGRLLYDAQGNRVLTDRLGTVRAAGGVARNYYPFGEEIGTPSANNTYKFASTYRDSTTGLDYAVNRYLSSTMGRFLSADPYQASGGPADPQSWNHYAYVQNDPINWRDSSGTNLENPDGSAREGRVPGGGGGLGSYSGYGSEGTSYTYFGPTLGGGVLAPGSGGGGGGGGGLSNSAPMQLDSATSKLLSDALDKEDCWKQLGATSAAAAKSALSGAKFFAKDLGVVNVTGNEADGYRFGWQNGETAGSNITVNANLFFEPSAKAWTVGEEKMSLLDIMAKTGYGQLSDTDYRAMVVIHELSHIMGRPNDQNDPDATKKFDLNTISNCLR